jgi:hypothetical protein
LIFIESVCEVDEQRRRLKKRQLHDTRSDGRVELMEHQRADFEPANPDHEDLFHIISTDGPKPQTRSMVEELLRSEGLLPERRTKDGPVGLTP